MTVLLYVVGLVTFFVALMASIGLHELGHMIPARLFGARVPQYFIGFGRTVWSRKRGETEYGLKAIPLGGYVKIIGMLPPAAGERDAEPTLDAEGRPMVKVRKSNTGMFTQLISDARAAEWELVRPGDEKRLFYRLAWWKKVIVMAGGPSVNIAIAFVIFAGVFATYGQRSIEVDAGPPVLEVVSACVIPYAEEGRDCVASDPATPAVQAGLQPGDTITTFNGTAVTSWDQLRELIRDNADGQATIGYDRDGQQLTGSTSTTVQARPTSSSDAALIQVGFLGVTPTTHVEVVTGGPLYTVREMGGMAVQTGAALVRLPAKVWDVGLAIVGVQERDPQGPVSIVGGGRLAGEATAQPDINVTEKLVFLLMIIAGFNFFIGLFNFLPLLPLDGGHIAGALWEALRRGWARLRGRPDPGYVDVAKLLPVAYVVGACLLVMGVVLIIGDLVVPVTLF